MDTFIRGNLADALATHSEKVNEEEHRRALVTERAATAASAILRTVVNGVGSYLEAARPDPSDQQRMPSRGYIAGLLSLIGEYDRPGHNRTQDVVLARDYEVNGVTYDSILARLTGVATKADDRIVHARSNLDVRADKPSDITEGHVVVAAVPTTNGQGMEFVQRLGAWVADYDMPQSYMNRDKYVQPAELGRMAQTMLGAMGETALNPQFSTLGFVSSVNYKLGQEVADLEKPLEEIEVGLFLPSWLQVAQAAN